MSIGVRQDFTRDAPLGPTNGNRGEGKEGTDIVALTPSEYRTAERLRADYWLYLVFNCANRPDVLVVQNPAKLEFRPVVKVEH